MMKQTVSTFFISILFALGLTACTDSGQEGPTTVGEGEAQYEQDTGMGTEQDSGIAEQEEAVDLPEESPAAGQQQDQDIQYEEPDDQFQQDSQMQDDQMQDQMQDDQQQNTMP